MRAALDDVWSDNAVFPISSAALRCPSASISYHSPDNKDPSNQLSQPLRAIIPDSVVRCKTGSIPQMITGFPLRCKNQYNKRMWKNAQERASKDGKGIPNDRDGL